MLLRHPVLSPRAPAAPWLRRLGAAATLLGVIGFVSSAALATVPATFSYQGVLTDNAGHLVPDGPYNLTFRLYSVASGGAALWTETQNALPVNKGGFSAVLGSVTPLTPSFDQQLYLGVAINGGAELAPRVVLTPSPQSLALRLPYTGTTNGTQASLTLINNGVGGRGLFVESSAYFGNSTYGSVLVGGPDRPFPVARMQSNGSGGYFSWNSSITGNNVGEIYASPATSSAVILLKRSTGSSTSFFLDSDQSGSGDPFLGLFGIGRTILFSPGFVGDGSVSLPQNSISAGEVLDEPGIAQEHNSGYVLISSSSATDLISVQITTPGPGYVVVEADGMHGIGGNGATENQADFSINETPGIIDFGNYYVSGFDTAAPSGLSRTSVSMRRTWYKPAAGTYVFYFTGLAANPASLLNYIWNPTLTATYFPSSYGTVTATASRGEASREGLDGVAARTTRGPGGERVPSDAVQVDLRVLELRAAKLREAAAQAEVEAMRARLAKSPEAKDASASAPGVER